MANQVASEQNSLAIHHKREASSGQPYGGPEPVPINHGVDQSGQQYRQDLERLRKLQPDEGHEDENGLVEEREKRQLSAAKNGEECAEQVEEAGEVEDVGPEEDSPRGTRAEGEAEEPLERGGGLGAAPEPASLADFSFCGKEHADENDSRD